jgi:protein-tyrosine phosphatase
MTIALSRLNFRDLGGLPVTGGFHIRPGLLYRCQGPGTFLDDHRQELSELDIRLVCDLRSDLERRAAVHDWGLSAILINLDLPNDFGSETSLGWKALVRHPTEAGARAAMRASYATMPTAIRPYMPTIVAAISEGNTPVLMHCTAGKDRTGVLVALLLLFVGVPLDAVIGDYLRSEAFGRNLRASGSLAPALGATFGFAPDQGTVDALIGVDTEFLMAALAPVDGIWGSVDGYFASVGVDSDRRAELRSILTERDSTLKPQLER